MRGPRPDSIRNGADDDGSGTVAILAIAEAFARASGNQRPRRSILFISHTGEEAGLLGSRWYSDHPTVPIDSIVGEIDQDMIGRGTASDFPRGGTGAGSPTYLEVIGAKRISREFGDMLEAANAKQPVPFVFDYTYDAPGHPRRTSRAGPPKRRRRAACQNAGPDQSGSEQGPCRPMTLLSHARRHA